MAAILKFKNIFASQKDLVGSYRYHHFLNTLPQQKLNEIQLFSESDKMESLLPALYGKRVLFFYDGLHKYIFKKTLTKNPNYLLSYCYTSIKPKQQLEMPYFVMGDLDKMPLRSDFYDVVICPFALQSNLLTPGFIKKACSLLRNGGHLILSLRHPQLEHILFNQNPSETFLSDNSVSSYFGALQAGHVYAEKIIEGCVDNGLKPFFSFETEKDYFAEYKNTPITLLFRGVKYSPKSGA
ncbi:MAG: methyltransferase domain-containing protein [bacterium]|nr:class I SAM-dependent methyltransferase [bacterium]MBU1918544.1 class I SAM-dependent methyltransferase [bacterium]